MKYIKYFDNIAILIVIAVTASIGMYACDYAQQPITQYAEPIAKSDCPPQHKGNGHASN